MKHFTWLAAVLVPLAAVWVWRSSSVMPEIEPVQRETVIVHDLSRPPAKRTAPREAVVEPILVLPEVEVAPAPVEENPFAEVRIGSAASNWRLFDNPTAPRPEVGRESRPWMPYAPEDRELSDTRRLQWAKLAVAEAASSPRFGEFEESEEPPLLSNGPMIPSR